MDVVHDAVDFLSTVDTPVPWELNIWYHTLNCGFRTRISGETDFPCIYGERVGLGRVYVKLDDGRLDFDRWCQGVKEGRSYVGDGRSHLIDFRVGDRGVGEAGSELKLPAPATVKVRARVAALLDAEPSAEAKAIRQLPLDQKPYWDIERARIGQSRKVPVELVVNFGETQMSIKQADRKTITVALVRPGVGRKVVELTEGSTVADLLRQTGASACHSNVFIGDKDLAEYAVLEAGMTVFLVPQPENAADREPWRETIGMFKDDPAFEEMMEAVQAARDAEKEQP